LEQLKSIRCQPFYWQTLLICDADKDFYLWIGTVVDLVDSQHDAFGRLTERKHEQTQTQQTKKQTAS
jgi:hypothetical protein